VNYGSGNDCDHRDRAGTSGDRRRQAGPTREKRLTIAEYAIARVKAQLEVTAAERELKPREQGLLELLTPVVEEYEARPSEWAR